MVQQILKININSIKQSPYQGRLLQFGISVADENQATLNQLSESIAQNGLLNPVVVRGIDNGYEMIDGHRRLEAHRILGLQTIDAIVKEVDERGAQVMSLVSNLQREDLFNIERALAFRKILDAGIFKDQKELSSAIGKDQTYVGDLLNTLNMDKRIIDDLLINKTTNDVRLLRAIRRTGKTDAEGFSVDQWNLYQRFLNEGLSRKEVFQLSSKEKTKQYDGLLLKFKPRKLEVDLPKKYSATERKILSKLIKEKLEELLNSFEEPTK